MYYDKVVFYPKIKSANTENNQPIGQAILVNRPGRKSSPVFQNDNHNNLASVTKMAQS